jgi:hypothetical protein
LVSLEDCVTTVLSPEQVLLATNRGDMYAIYVRHSMGCISLS